jgi:hypothetical protein
LLGSISDATPPTSAITTWAAGALRRRAACGTGSSSPTCVGVRRIASNGTYAPFVDPALAAPEAPLCWIDAAAAPCLEAIVERAPSGECADLDVAALPTTRHLVATSAGAATVPLRDSDQALSIRMHGQRPVANPVTVAFQTPGIPNPAEVAVEFAALMALVHHPGLRVHRTREHEAMRDALVALDAQSVGASHRETAEILVGPERTRTEWGANSALKLRARRALAKGQELRDGGWRRLLQRAWGHRGK